MVNFLRRSNLQRISNNNIVKPTILFFCISNVFLQSVACMRVIMRWNRFYFPTFKFKWIKLIGYFFSESKSFFSFYAQTLLVCTIECDQQMRWNECPCRFIPSKLFHKSFIFGSTGKLSFFTLFKAKPFLFGKLSYWKTFLNFNLKTCYNNFMTELSRQVLFVFNLNDFRLTYLINNLKRVNKFL